MRVVAAVLMFAVACGGKSGPAPVAVANEPAPAFMACREAAANLVGLGVGSDPAWPDAATIAAECEQLRLSDAEARCLARAEDKMAALVCPRPLTPELRESEDMLGLGPCRVVLVTVKLAEVAEMREFPEDQRADKQKAFDIAFTEVASSCRGEDWGAEAMTCFATSEPRAGIACMDKVPRAIREGIQSRVNSTLSAR